MMLDVICTVIPVIDSLEKLSIQYYICGSVASAAYGVIRSATDIDLVADLQIEHVSPFVEMLCNDYYFSSKAVRAAIDQKTYFNLVHLATMFKIDVFTAKTSSYQRLVFERKQSLSILENSSRTFFIATPEDTILSKLESCIGEKIPERHWNDILGMMKVEGDNLDRDYLQKWAAELHFADLLERANKEV